MIKQIFLFIIIILIQDMPVFGATLSVPGSYGTIQAALTAASSGDVIDIAAGTYTELNLVVSNKSLTIKGAGIGSTIVQAFATANNTPATNSGVFKFDGTYTSGVTVNVQDMTIKNAFNSNAGGGIRLVNSGTQADAPNFNFTRLSIVNNVSTDGGGIYVVGAANLVVTNCNISSNNMNSSSGFGGGIAIIPGGAYAVNATFRNTTIANNTSSGAGAGVAVICGANGATAVSHALVFENTTIYGNSSTTSAKLGGGVDFRCAGSGQAVSPTQAVTINHCTIVNNTTNTATGGDGVCFDNGSYQVSLTMNNSIVMGNSGSTSNQSQIGTNAASQSIITNSGISNCIMGIISGGTWATAGTTHNNLSAVIGDLAFVGALSNDATPVLTMGTGSIARDYVSSNSILTNDQLGNLRDDKPDAGAYELRSSVTISAGTGGSVSGGGTNYTKGDNVALVATPNAGYRFVSWTLNTSGGAVQSTSASYSFTLAYSVTLVANFTPTTLYVPSVHATIQAALTAAVSGDIIDIAAGTYTEKNLTISNKSVTIRGAGRSLTIVQAFATANNTPANNSGVFNLDGTYSSGVTVTMQDMTIRNGYNTFSGGGIRINNAGTQVNAPTLNLTNLNIVNNTSANGGGVYIVGPVNLVVDGCNISSNNMNSSSGYGGGIAFLPGTVYVVSGIIRNSTISNNICAGPGGGIAVICGENAATAVAHSLWLENSTIYGNSCTTTADVGGGIYFRLAGGGQAVSPTQSVTINHCTIANNTTISGTGGDGVAFANAVYQISLAMKNSIVMGNSGSSSNQSQIGVNAASQTMITNAGISNCIMGIISGGTWVTAGTTHNNLSAVIGDLAFANALSNDATPILKLGTASVARDYVATDLLSPTLITDQIGRARVGNADAGAYESGGAQTITFGALGNKLLSDAAFALTATASSSLSVTYTSSNTAVATVSGSTVTIVGAGSTNITASQAGDNSYAPAADVVQSFTVSNTYNLPTTASISALTKLTAASDVVISGTLNIDADKTVHSVTVQPNAKLNLSNTNTLTVTDLVLEVGKSTAPSVSVTHAMTVTGTVKVNKTLDNTVWYFISFPSNVAVNSITQISGTGTLGAIGTNWWVKYYDGSTRATNGGATSNWVNMTAGQTLTANKGYVIGLADALTGDYVLSFPFVDANAVSSAEVSKTVTVGLYGEGTAATSNVGWNLVGVPYLSKFDGSGVGASYITVYNGATYDQYANTGIATLNPFTSFFIQASAAGTTTNLAFTLGNRQLVKSSVANELSNRVQINLTTPTGSDHTNLIIDDSQSTDYVINQDLNKWITTGTDKPQLYTCLGGINYAYNALPIASVNNLPLAFYSRTATESIISVDGSQAPTLSQLILTDNLTGTTTDLLSSDYRFNASVGTTSTRFTVSAMALTTSEINDHFIDNSQISLVNRKIVISKLSKEATVKVYDDLGRMLIQQKSADSRIEIPLSEKGVYLVVVIDADKNIKRKLLVRN